MLNTAIKIEVMWQSKLYGRFIIYSTKLNFFIDLRSIKSKALTKNKMMFIDEQLRLRLNFQELLITDAYLYRLQFEVYFHLPLNFLNLTKYLKTTSLF